MQVTLTAKIKILPDSPQAELLNNSLRAYTDACNHVSGYIQRTQDLAPASLQKALYRELRGLYSLRSQMAQSAMKTVAARYKSVLANEGKWLPVKIKRQECDLVWNRDFSLVCGLFSVNTLSGRVKLPFCTEGMERFFDGSWRFGTAKLLTRRGKWYLHVPVSKEHDVPEDSAISNIVGVDLGVNHLATAYDSMGRTAFYPGREVKHRRAQYAKTRKELQRRGTPSARRRLAQIGSRENRWMRDVNHRVSKALVQSQPPGSLFVLEDLTGIRSATERVRLKDRYVSVSWAFYDLRKKIEYKALCAGSKSVSVDPRHTSQSCTKCGHTEKANRDRRRHSFCCRDCGYTSNDDRIGAMNLHRKGMEYLCAVAGG